ncbi:hypothetical protein CCACVL1_23612 [Corchorus capsularis]|uniref:Uncharacterized protein n=1 Tax=Corchorus capsularis TaxID=210143 RepID=A0A1R3GTE3_COCAP|nr:hypothetical protein CCACVL1_23612 [Corchorus capsularis]
MAGIRREKLNIRVSKPPHKDPQRKAGKQKQQRLSLAAKGMKVRNRSELKKV